jgi:hypothetical protein
MSFIDLRTISSSNDFQADMEHRLPNGPGRLAPFGAPNDGPVRGMHFGGLVRPGTESEYLGPDIDDCSFRIRF